MKLCVLIPALNCARVLPDVVGRISLPGPSDEIIVVDDASEDDTLAVAQSLPRVFAARNPAQSGYGGTSQRLYELAMERGADMTINIHGDLGHKPESIGPIVERLKHGDCPIVLGSRLVFLMDLARREGWLRLLNGRARFQMPLSRMFGHYFLTGFQNLCFNTNIHSFHEGMRGCTRPVVEWILRNKFSPWYDYDTTLLVYASRAGFRIGEVPVPPNYETKAPSSAPPVMYGLRVVGRTLQLMREIRREKQRNPVS